MRFLREVSASILRARFSLSAVSSSTELLAVLTSIPSFLRRSMTSWLGSPRSRASWKTLTLSIRLPPLDRPFTAGHGRRGFALFARGFGLRRRCGSHGFRFRRRCLGFRRRCGFLGGDAVRLGLSRFLGVARVPLRLGENGRLANL